MRRHRFYVPTVDHSLKAITDRAQVHQIRDVLRAKVGDELLLWKSGEGVDYVFVITHMALSRIEGAVSDTVENDREPRTHVSLYCSLLKRENFELVLQKAVEVGVGTIIPVVSQRTIKARLNMDRARAIIQEAAEQSGRGVMPELHEVTSFDGALEHAKGNGRNCFYHCGVIDFDTSRSACPSDGRDRTGVFIGPEGGWTDAEVTRARLFDCHITSLGPLTLRAETAAIVASYLACV